MWGATWFVILDYEFTTAAPIFYLAVCGFCTIFLLFLKKILLFTFDKGLTPAIYSSEPFSSRAWGGVTVGESKFEADEETQIDTLKNKADLGPINDGDPIEIEMNEMAQKRVPPAELLPVRIELNPTLDSPMFDQLEADRRSNRDTQVKQRNGDFFGSLGKSRSVAAIGCSWHTYPTH